MLAACAADLGRATHLPAAVTTDEPPWTVPDNFPMWFFPVTFWVPDM